jgi:hypothetical protein
MTLRAPCYGSSDYWSAFHLDYAGQRVLDILRLFVQLDRCDRSGASTRAYFGRVQR